MKCSTLCYLVKDGNWLMLLRNKKENDINQGKWIGVGGKIEAGETPAECAKREIFEETGYIVKDLRFCGTVLFNPNQDSEEKIWVYRCDDFEGELANCSEGTLSWIPETNLMDLNLWPGDRKFLPSVINQESCPFHWELGYDSQNNLVHVLEKRNDPMSKTIIIGIAGGSASGKTSIAEKIKEMYIDEQSVLIIRQDDYYKDQSHMPMEERVKTNYDHPFAFDNDLLIQQIHELVDGQTIQKPTYDFVNHTRSDVTEICNPADVIILEGLFVLEDEQLRDLLDIKVFVSTDADVRFIRRLLRDVKERGRSLDSVVNQYTNTVRVMHEMFIEPSKRYADIIIPEGGSNTVAIDLLTTKISSIIHHTML